VAVDGRVNTEREEVLMVWSHHTWSHNSTVRDGISDVNRAGGQDPCRTDFVADCTSLIEVERKYIFVVAYRNDCLQNKKSSTGNNCVASSVVGMFPEDAIVYLMTTDYIGDLDRISSARMGICIEVLNMS